MFNYLLYILNVLYLFYLMIMTVLLLSFAPLILLVYKLINKGKVDDGIRWFNHFYGTYLVKISWPWVRIDRKGMENLATGGSCVVVVNHRSTADMFFGSLFTPFNTAVFVRSWPFKLWGFGWFMNLAGYVDVEKTHIHDFLTGRGRKLYERGVSFLFYPEGHRSRDGKLQRFQSGAFLTATEFNIPIVPVFMKGTEKFLAMKNPVIRPAKIEVEILPPVYPSDFPDDKRALKLKRFVETLFRRGLDE